MGNLDYRGLAVLDAVASTGSFEKAALNLGISQSAVSQRIKALEDAAGRLLVVRGTPSVATGLGQRLVAHYRNVKLMEAALDIDLGREASLPELAIVVDSDSLATWFGKALAPLLSPPRCQMTLQLADTEQALRLLRDGAAFGCVAASDGSGDSAAGTAATELGLMRYVCVATPAFAGHWFGDGFVAEAVQLAPAVMCERRLLVRYLKQRLGVMGTFPRHVLPSAEVLTASVVAGAAYGLVPELMALQLLANGQLVELDPGHTWDVALAWHAWKIDTPFARALSEQVIDAARRHLLQP
jgi:LysR family transcriptional regulator (chromosome initiation inhibitor)